MWVCAYSAGQLNVVLVAKMVLPSIVWKPHPHNYQTFLAAEVSLLHVYTKYWWDIHWAVGH